MLTRLALTAVVALTLSQSSTSQVYRDPSGRFTFSYPSSFGVPGRGTDDGFQDRVAAVGFSTIPVTFKGEAVLTSGFPLFDLQAVSGLYDSIALQIFPDAIRQQVVSHLPRLTAANFCTALAQPTHLDPALPVFASLTPPQRAGIAQVDTMRNADPHVIRCAVVADVIVFDKARAGAPGGPTQHVFGAVRFLPQPYSTFQLIAGGAPPDEALLSAIADVVRSFKTNGATGRGRSDQALSAPRR